MHNFHGEKILIDVYSEITSDIKNSYNNGLKLCLTGSHGTGKTTVASCILKRVAEKGYTALYTTLTDVVSLMTSRNSDDKYEARRAILMVDFLVIDEFDPRHMGTDNASELYGRILESTLRSRIQNKMPLIMCSNSPNVVNSFSGALKQSIGSLFNMVRIVPVVGKDYRTTRK